MAQTKTGERQLAAETKSPKKRNSVRYPFSFFEKNTQPKIFRREIPIKNTNRNERNREHRENRYGEKITPKIFWGPLFQSEKRHRRESAPTDFAEITPKNRHWLRGLDGKYGKWNES